MTCKNCKCEIPTINVYRRNPNTPLPRYQTDGAACFDLAFSPDTHDTLIKVVNLNGDHEYAKITPGTVPSLEIFPNMIYMIPTGLWLDIPQGHSLRVFARSSTPIKYGLEMANSVGVVDEDYTDEIFLLMRSFRYTKIDVGTRLAQAELVKYIQPDIRVLYAPPQPKGNRTGGFGSTGN